jgi:hypothetical protein
MHQKPEIPLKKSALTKSENSGISSRKILISQLVARTSIKIDLAKCLFGVAAIIAAANSTNWLGFLVSKF